MEEQKKSTYRGYTEAGNKAHQRYAKAHLDVLKASVQKGRKARYMAAADALGMSFAAFMTTAMDEKISRDLPNFEFPDDKEG